MNMTYRTLYECEGLPVLQNKTFATRDEAVQSGRGDMKLVQDEETGLIYNNAFNSEKLVYDENYQNEQCCSSSFRYHLDQVRTIIDRHSNDKRILEIGCGKGYFLECLLADGYDAYGIDPAYQGTNPRVIKELFISDLDLYGDVVILRHVLEHIEKPLSFLADIAKANGNYGLIYIEVSCFDWICKHRTWFDVFYEHVNYFRLTDFHRIFERVIESGRLFGDQYLYLVADLASIRPIIDRTRERVALPDDFLSTRKYFRNLNDKARAIWGASSKGVIFAMHMQQLSTKLDFAIDINPVKQGRYLPCSGLRVASPEEAMNDLPAASDIIVMNSNYLDEIKHLSGNCYNYITIDI